MFYKLFIEFVFLLSRPLLWLILPLYHYKEAIETVDPRSDHPILIHCASVGEVNAIAPLIRILLDNNIPLYLNTVTVTGRDLVKNSFPDLPVRLAPLDIASLREQNLKAISPRLILIVETEIWPMFLESAAKLHIPVAFINARMSEITFASYFRIKSLLRYLSRSVEMIMTQSEDDLKRFDRIFCCSIVNAGNLKYCLSLPEYSSSELRNTLGFEETDTILVWGSSRPGEEALLKSILPMLRDRFENLKVILAPRHPKRCAEVERILNGLSYRKLSDSLFVGQTDLLLIDSLGHMAQAYAVADLVVVGGSFYNFGGHNPLEPAYYSKAVIIGNYHQSCKASVLKLQENEAIVVSNADNLASDVSSLLLDEDKRKDMGQRAKKVLTENAHALDVHVKGIYKCLR